MFVYGPNNDPGGTNRSSTGHTARPGRPPQRNHTWITGDPRQSHRCGLRTPWPTQAASCRFPSRGGAAARPRGPLGYMQVSYTRSGPGLVKLASTEYVMASQRTTTDQSLGCLRRQHGTLRRKSANARYRKCYSALICGLGAGPKEDRNWTKPSSS